MFVVIWQYEVDAGCEPAFEALYGESGAWVALFREHAGYLGTELLREAGSARYLTIDRWSSESDYDAFVDAAKSRYAAIDAQGDALTLDERLIGRYRLPC